MSTEHCAVDRASCAISLAGLPARLMSPGRQCRSVTVSVTKRCRSCGPRPMGGLWMSCGLAAVPEDIMQFGGPNSMMAQGV